ncbi:hypothetical protein BTVI_104639 [Pitangus sulphuratus]|nr:hypothetical protein BTVI_104639 [Pitangus sulphuratus]
MAGRDILYKALLHARSRTGYPQDNWPPELVDRDGEQNSPVVQEEAVSDLLTHLDAHKSIGPDGLHLRLDERMTVFLMKVNLPMLYSHGECVVVMNTYRCGVFRINENEKCSSGTDEQDESFWVRIKGQANTGDNVVDVYCRPPDSEEEDDKAFYGQLEID